MGVAAALEPLVTAQPPSNGEDVLYEVVNGQYVELSPMSTLAGMLATQLVVELGTFSSTHSLGRVACEVLFGLNPENTLRRRPDVAFVSYQRWAQNRVVPLGDPWPVVPNLAVEVVSPSDLAEQLLEKLVEYFQAGVELVWVVYPQLSLVYVYESLHKVHGLGRQDELDGSSVLPGFRLSLARLFADAPAV
jgi:Uma2 family endonuclease